MAELAVPHVITAATQLMRAAQWNAAADLIRATRTDDLAERGALALTLAEIAVDQDFAQGTQHAAAALAAAAKALDAASDGPGKLPDATSSWDLAMLRLRTDYGTELVKSGELTFGPEGRDESSTSALAERATDLRDQAPDDSRRGLVSFYAGLIADNLQGDPETAFAHFTEAWKLGETAGDDLVAGYALRHLGDHAHTAGDLDLARAHWERSTELRQKVGHVFGALAQQALLAVLLRDEGDLDGSHALAAEVNRWSRQAHLPYLTSQTDALLK